MALVVAAALTALLALALDTVLFKRLRKRGSITLVIASFGAALVLRNLLLFWQGGVPKYFSQNLQIAMILLPRSFRGGLRFTPDQLLVLVLTLATVGPDCICFCALQRAGPVYARHGYQPSAGAGFRHRSGTSFAGHLDNRWRAGGGGRSFSRASQCNCGQPWARSFCCRCLPP